MQDSAMTAEHKASLVIDLAIVELPAMLGHANRFTDTEENYVLPTPDEKNKNKRNLQPTKERLPNIVHRCTAVIVFR